MALQSPVAPAVGEQKELYATLEALFLFVFTAEVALKQYAFGVGGYFSDGWNAFDFFVVSTAWIRVLLPDAGNLTALRAARVLRALRMVNRVPSLKRIIQTLFVALPQLANVVTLFMGFIFLFGILGVNLFAGKLHFRCTEAGAQSPIDDKALCVRDADCGGAATCVYYATGPDYGAISYDDVLSAWATIFQAVTLEGWADQMYMLQKTAGDAPAIVFYILVVAIGSFFLVNLFLAVLFDAFSSAQQETRRESMARASLALQAAQEMGLEGVDDEAAQAAQAQAKVKAARGGGDAAVGAGTTHLSRRAENLVYLLIGLNTLTMCSNYYGESEAWVSALDSLNVLFTCCFFAEMVYKLCLLGRAYFASGWNRFDFFVTWCSLVDLILDAYGHDTELLRALRVGRVMRLLRLNRKMRRFEETVVLTGGLVLNLSAILLLIMLVFSLLGMELFGARMGAPPPRPNFDDFFHSFVTVFTITSGEDWNSVFSLALEFGVPWTEAACFFFTLFIAGNYVLVNLFVAIISWGWETASPPEEQSPKYVEVTVSCAGLVDGGDYDGRHEAAYRAALAELAGDINESLIYLDANDATTDADAGPGAAAAAAAGGAGAGARFEVTAQITPERPGGEEELQAKAAGDKVAACARQAGLTPLTVSHASIVDTEEEEAETSKSRLKAAQRAVDDRCALLMAAHAGASAAADGAGLGAEEAAALKRALAPLASDFCTAARDATMAEGATVATVESVAGLAKGFATLAAGLQAALAAVGTATPPPPGEALLVLAEYWDSAHAADAALVLDPEASAGRLRGGNARLLSTAALLDELELLVKAYAMALPSTAGGGSVAGTRLAEVRRLARAQLVEGRASQQTASLGARAVLLRFARDCAGALCGGSTSSAAGAEDGGAATGAASLPLGDVAQLRRVRRVRELISSASFERFILGCIFGSSAALAFDGPDVDPSSRLAHSLAALDYLFTAIFVAEMSLKLFALGAFSKPDGYFQSRWNQLDAAIVVSSVISLIPKLGDGLGALRAMRALRALRPLRVIKRLPGLAKVVNSLLRAVPQVGDVAQVCFLVLVVYGLFGVQLLMGRMAECNDPSRATKADCVGDFVDASGAAVPRWWGNDDIGNFDNIGAAMLTLFEMSTLEMWPDLMYRAMDSNPEEMGVALERDQNKGTIAPFLISWILVSSFLLLNLFIGVVLENFNAIRRQEDGSGFMSDQQQEWSRTLHTIWQSRTFRKATEPAEGKTAFARLRRRCFRLVEGDRDKAAAFEKFVALLVLLNVMSMAVTWYEQPAWVDLFAAAVDDFFTLAFTCEMALKLLGLGLAQYVADPWNLLDASLVSASLIDHALQTFASNGLPISPTMLRFMRFFRIARLLKLIKINPGIKRLLKVVVVSAPSLGNVGVLLLLIMYIFAVLGVQMFAHVAHGEFINDDANFSSFGAALLTLFRCITGESYNGIMHDAMVTEEHSAPGRCSNAEGNCGTPLAAPYFVLYVVIGSFTMLNVFIAVILDAFAEDEAAERSAFKQEHIDEFTAVWQRFDRGETLATPRGGHDFDTSNLLETKHLAAFLKQLPAPMGYKDRPGVSMAEVLAFVAGLQDEHGKLKDRNGFVAYHDLLYALANAAHGQVDLTKAAGGFDIADSEVGKALAAMQKSAKAESKVYDLLPSTSEGPDLLEEFAVTKVQAAIRRKNLARGKGTPGSTAALLAGRGVGGDRGGGAAAAAAAATGRADGNEPSTAEAPPSPPSQPVATKLTPPQLSTQSIPAAVSDRKLATDHGPSPKLADCGSGGGGDSSSRLGRPGVPQSHRGAAPAAEPEPHV